jgi:hypothetical protein
VSRRLAADVEAATREVTAYRQQASSGGPRAASKLDDVIAKRAELRQQLVESRAKEKALVDAAMQQQQQQPTAHSHPGSTQPGGEGLDGGAAVDGSGVSSESGGMGVAGLALEESEREKLIRTGKLTPFGTAPVGVFQHHTCLSRVRRCVKVLCM